MEDTAPRPAIPLGLWELDAAGTVLHYEPTKGERLLFQPLEVIGRNFFSEVMPASQAQEFRERFGSFMSGHAPAHSLDFTLLFEQGGVRTRILLARIHGRLASGDAESILIHIRRA